MLASKPQLQTKGIQGSDSDSQKRRLLRSKCNCNVLDELNTENISRIFNVHHFVQRYKGVYSVTFLNR